MLTIEHNFDKRPLAVSLRVMSSWREGPLFRGVAVAEFVADVEELPILRVVRFKSRSSLHSASRVQGS